MTSLDEYLRVERVSYIDDCDAKNIVRQMNISLYSACLLSIDILCSYSK